MNQPWQVRDKKQPISTTRLQKSLNFTRVEQGNLKKMFCLLFMTATEFLIVREKPALLTTFSLKRL